MTRARQTSPRTLWTDEQLDLLRMFYPSFNSENVAFMVGHSVRSTYQKARALGLKKSAELMSTESARRISQIDHPAREHRFQKGLVPWNKGTKGVVGVHEACRATQFKPGERRGVAVKLYQPIGTERVSKDGYLERKVNDDMPLQKRWRAVHLVVWEAANGLLPKGHAVTFKDGNKRNLALENLELVSRADLMRRNTRHNLPPELQEIVQLRAVLTRQINKRRKHDGP